MLPGTSPQVGDADCLVYDTPKKRQGASDVRQAALQSTAGRRNRSREALCYAQHAMTNACSVPPSPYRCSCSQACSCAEFITTCRCISSRHAQPMTSSTASGPCKLLSKPHIRPLRGRSSTRQPTVTAMRAVVQRVKSASVTVHYSVCALASRPPEDLS